MALLERGRGSINNQLQIAPGIATSSPRLRFCIYPHNEGLKMAVRRLTKATTATNCPIRREPFFSPDFCHHHFVFSN